jgi:hypothetical protein
MRGSGQLVGWSLVAALPLRVLAHQTDVVPVYDAGLGRLYMIDAQPGGSGLAAWLYRNLEAVLPLAYDVALDYHSDPLLEPAARADMDWLLTMLGGEFTLPERPATTGVSREIPEHDSQPSTSRVAPEQPDQPPAPPEPAQPGTPESPAEPPAEPPASPPAPQPEQAEAADASPPQEARPAKKTRRSSSGKRRSTSASKQEQDEQSATKSTGTTKGRRKRAAAAEPEAPPADKTEVSPARSEASPAEPETSSSEAQAAPAEAKTESMLADPKAILARLLRMREQYEQQPLADTDTPSSAESAAPAAPTAPRFQVGERVFCLPYGAGIVRANRFVQDRELLSVEFPDLGQIEVDPAVNVVRRIEASANEQANDA